MRSVWENREALPSEIKYTLMAAAPLMGAQLIQIGNGVIDTIVSGQLGRVQLAAVGIGSSLWLIVLLSSIGLMAGLSPTMAKLLGQGYPGKVGVIYRQGLWLGLILGLIDLALLMIVQLWLPHWGFEESLSSAIQQYLRTASWGIVPAVVLLAPRNVCESVGRTKPVLVVQVAGLLINLVADLGFGLGWFGLPKLGIAGIGWSTTLVMLSTSILLLVMLKGADFQDYQPYRTFSWPQLADFKPLLILSLPICLSLMFEASLFTATAIQIGKLNVVSASAHHIAMGATAVFYMLPLGLSFALTGRIGIAVGQSDTSMIKLRTLSGVLITFGMALCSSVILLGAREVIAALYTQDPSVQLLATQLLVLAAIFQLSDAMQATLLGCLRGLQDTRVPMLVNAVSYWVVGFGSGYYSAHALGMGAHGFWIGLIIGLSLSAALLGWRLYHLLYKPKSAI